MTGVQTCALPIYYEFGSPKLPMFPEALMLHYLDDMDSKIQGMQSILARDASVDGDWTGYLPSLGRTLLNVQKFLDTSRKESTAAAAGPEAGGQNSTTPSEAAGESSKPVAPRGAQQQALPIRRPAEEWKQELQDLRGNLGENLPGADPRIANATPVKRS